MLSHHSRLSREEFGEIFRRARRAKVPGGQLLYVPLPQGGFKAAVVVSKKVAKTAVLRNRLRRQIYSHMRRWVQRGGAFIVILSPEIRSMSMENFLQGLEGTYATQFTLK